MAETVSLVNVPGGDNWQSLIDKVNLYANLFNLYVVTTDGTGGNTISGGSITTGNAYVNGYFSAKTIAVNGTLRGGNVASNGMLNIDTGFQLSSASGATNNAVIAAANVSLATNAAAQVIDSYLMSTYRTGKYVAQVTNSLGMQTSELLMVHNGSAGFITEYAVLSTNGVLGTFTSSANATAVILLFNPSTVAAVQNVNIHKILLTV